MSGPRRRRHVGWVLAATLSLVSAACGARLSPQEIAAASRNRGGTGQAGSTATNTDGSGTTDGGAASPDAGAAGTSDASASGPGSTGGGDTTGASNQTGATLSGADASPSTPAGGNGGASDVGVTANQISLGNVSTLTGPVPGLFKGAVVGTQAFLAYQNSLGGVFGRQLKLLASDDRLDAGANKAAVQQLIPKVFAFVGSFSVFDDAGVPAMQQANVPDVGAGLSHARAGMPNGFSPQPISPGWALGRLNYWKAKYGDAVTKNMALFWANVPSARDQKVGIKAAAESVGYHFSYERELQATEANFTSDVLQMRSRGVKGIFMLHDASSMARMAKAVKQQGLELKLANWGSNGYDKKFLQIASSAAEGAQLDQHQAMYLGKDRAMVPEVDLMFNWVNRISPNFNIDLFTAYAWASGRLFVQALKAAGPKATRAGLLAELRKIDDFDSNGLLSPAGPASKRAPTCFMVIKVQNGKFVRADPPGKGFLCNYGGYFKL